MPCLRRGSGAASPGERRRPVGEQRPRRACLLRQPPRRARMEAAADGARYASPSPKGACHAPGKEASRRRRLPPKHNCLNMLWMEVSLVSFVRLLGHGRARAKAEPRLVLQICSHCTSKGGAALVGDCWSSRSYSHPRPVTSWLDSWLWY
ncbi:hypothetical protein PVAP13_2NG298800 [Panicum virgatum]|uniref:Uncharacterized protein n=1 Tax=Panicum virgatum TaxID=38727 RepID=A0A8T0VF70_PANVG|nr:hypothetical protein PVAP13_2NG298800 [Panicum virgatum]